MKPLTCVIVGSGSIARRHISNLLTLSPKCRIILVQRKKSSLGSIEGVDSVVHTVHDSLAFSPDFAVIANPAPFHIQSALVFAEYGCHLFIEKPLSDSTQLLASLNQVCSLKSLVLFVGYNLRFDPSLITLHNELLNGLIGRPIHFSFQVGQYLPHWRPHLDYRESVSAQQSLGGGPLLELSHEIDLALWLGGPIKSISANIASVSDLDIDTEDSVDLMFTYSSGAMGTIHLDFLRQSSSRSCCIIGTNGCFEWNFYDSSLVFTSNSQVQNYICSSCLVDRNHMYLQEMRHFLSCIDGIETPRVTFQDGVQVLSAIMAARQSAVYKRFVNIPTYD